MMKIIYKSSKILIVFLMLLVQHTFAQNNYYFPKATALDAKVPSPEQYLGYPIGSYFTRYERVVDYFRELAKISDRVHVESIGKTYEQREQIIVTITSPANYTNLEQIRQDHLNQVDPSKPALSSNAPVIVHLGYGVHGNETSSTEVSLLAGYYLAASQDAETKKWLDESVIFIDPALNPDGRDRAANWHNAYHSFPAVGDPIDKEHQEAWPNGRTNHYFTDLNRDWLNLVQIESRNRLVFFHKWYPNVQIDFHEQGTNATYYFEPSPKRHESPVIPQFIYDFNVVLAKYHAKALDDIGSFYFTKENYDNLSPIYGSTYPKFFGSVAATFEQASSRGILQESSNGPLTFAFTIRNHLATSFSTIRGSVAEKAGLFKVQKDFFKYALEQGQKNPAKTFVFGDSKDVNLTQKFLGLLLQHHINVYELSDNTTHDGKTFEKGKAYVVPSAQPNFLLVHSIFEENVLKDSIFYDNTGWSIIHAYGLKYAKLNVAIAKGNQVTALIPGKGAVEGGKSPYAYLINYSDYNASKALYQLQLKNVLVKTAFKGFSANTPSGKRAFGNGSLVVPVVGQTLSADSLYSALQTVAAETNINILSVTSGFSAEGIDLGSSNIKAVRKPEVALAFGQGVTSSEAGQVWFLLNQQLNLPVTKIDLASFSRASLGRYNTLVLPGGNYSAWDKETVGKIKAWVNEGGTLITFQNATAWAVQNEIVKERLSETEAFTRRGETPLVSSQAIVKEKAPAGGAKDAPAKPEVERLDYARQEDVEGSRRINGAIFQADLDISHPIAFGITDRKLFINKNGPTLLLPSANKYATVAQYTSKPFINGYSSKTNIGKVANSAAIIATASGSGEVVLFADDPTYRGYWLGTSRLFLNAVFFANLLNGGYR
ncbi:M14 family zinc carboxypeptidase [Pedobacter panaciterrae]|uniref:M14 family zinc carboxypeptidase n=1 Tax=Pedobacter panaciterrae TaxID=363849 RepID=A0ABU8NKB8_9SPHI